MQRGHGRVRLVEPSDRQRKTATRAPDACNLTPCSGGRDRSKRRCSATSKPGRAQMVRDGGEGWRPWRAVPRIAAGAILVPVVVGFVALGAIVVVVRSLRDVARDTWARVPAWRSGVRSRSGERDSDAAW